jgi:hypothetical protein
MNSAPSALEPGNPILGGLAYPVTDEKRAASLKEGFIGYLVEILGKD